MARNHKLNLAQRRAAEILANNDIHQMSLAQVAEHVGVSHRTLYRWKQDKDFVRYQNEIAEQLMEDFLAEAYTTLKGMVRKGRSDSWTVLTGILRAIGWASLPRLNNITSWLIAARRPKVNGFIP